MGKNLAHYRLEPWNDNPFQQLICSWSYPGMMTSVKGAMVHEGSRCFISIMRMCSVRVKLKKKKHPRLHRYRFLQWRKYGGGGHGGRGTCPPPPQSAGKKKVIQDTHTWVYPPPHILGGGGLYYHPPPQYFTVECHIIPTKYLKYQQKYWKK